MRKTMIMLLLVSAVVVGCTPSFQLALQEEQKNGAHFATWSHMAYSLNRGTAETTTAQDLKLAQADRCLPSQTCPWWGEAVKVQPIH